MSTIHDLSLLGQKMREQAEHENPTFGEMVLVLIASPLVLAWFFYYAVMNRLDRRWGR